MHKDYPKDPQVLLGLGQSLTGLVVKKGGPQVAEAIAVLNATADAVPNSPVPDILAAEVYLARNDLAGARERLARGRAKNPDAMALMQIQMLERRMGGQ